MQRIVRHQAVTHGDRITDTAGRVVECDDPPGGYVHGAGNRPLAGQSVTCPVQALEVRDATPDETATGRF